MKTEKKPFLPIETDIDDQKLEQLAASKGVSALVKPAPERGAATARQDAPSVETAATDGNSDKPTVFKKSGVMLPEYAWTALRVEAAKRGTTSRYILMSGLRKEGINIRDEDMVEDGRRETGNA